MDELLTDSLRKRMVENNAEFRRLAQDTEAAVSIEDRRLPGLTNRDFVPVVKLFTPDANCVWLLTELDADNAFGLHDLGMGYPDLGYVSISDIESICGPTGRRIERDGQFAPTHSISAYARAAYSARSIIEDETALHRAAMALAADRSVSE
ncbi:MAG: DUF2958 domain-containing protein [Rhodospirillaceae bacterium]|nr:DUF2958 domain-containing protein [Rhodospirillaceae bacterium]